MKLARSSTRSPARGRCPLIDVFLSNPYTRPYSPEASSGQWPALIETTGSQRLLVAGLVVGAVALPSATWSCVLAALLGLAGVVLFRGNRWRTGALLVAALALSLALLDAFAGWLSPARRWATGWCARPCPSWWPPPDPILGFRPASPTAEVLHIATYGRETDLSPHLSLRRRRRARHAAGAAGRRHLPVHRRFLHLRPGPGRRRDAGLAVRRAERPQGAHRQSRRAGQLAQPARARLRGGPARPLPRAAGQGGGDLDHPGAACPHHRRGSLARLHAALRAGRRQAAPHRLVQRVSPAQSPRRRPVSIWASSSRSSTRSA